MQEYYIFLSFSEYPHPVGPLSLILFIFWCEAGASSLAASSFIPLKEQIPLYLKGFMLIPLVRKSGNKQGDIMKVFRIFWRF